MIIDNFEDLGIEEKTSYDISHVPPPLFPVIELQALLDFSDDDKYKIKKHQDLIWR